MKMHMFTALSHKRRAQKLTGQKEQGTPFTEDIKRIRSY